MSLRREVCLRACGLVIACAAGMAARWGGVLAMRPGAHPAGLEVALAAFTFVGGTGGVLLLLCGSHIFDDDCTMPTPPGCANGSRPHPHDRGGHTS